MFPCQLFAPAISVQSSPFRRRRTVRPSAAPLPFRSRASLVAAAREADPLMDIRLADAGALPLEDASADLAIAFMSLQDIDDMVAGVREVARVLEPGGRFCVAIVHPINSARTFRNQ